MFSGLSVGQLASVGNDDAPWQLYSCADMITDTGGRAGGAGRAGVRGGVACVWHAGG